jgi:dienelactone hydrolase
MRVIALLLALAALCAPAAAQGVRERIAVDRTFKGRAIAVTGDLMLPSGRDKVPAMIVHHGSGGVSERERRYARELVKWGVAALVLDSFGARGVKSTVRDQASVSSFDMLDDAFAALKALAGHARIDASRIGILGFSKGGSVALLSAHQVRAERALPGGARFALHVPVYPTCTTQYYRPKTTGAPIYLLQGGADTYAGVAPCQDYAAALRAEGARIETVVFPGAQHGFDGRASYRNPHGENYSRCIFAQQPDGTWKERASGVTAIDANGRRIEARYKRALAKCRTYGVSGGPDPSARARAMALLEGYVRRHLLDRQP